MVARATMSSCRLVSDSFESGGSFDTHGGTTSNQSGIDGTGESSRVSCQSKSDDGDEVLEQHDEKGEVFKSLKEL